MSLQESYAQVAEASSRMRLRPVPKRVNDLYEPVWVAPAPGNEATLIRRKNGGLTIFYINRPGDANQLRSISSRDGIYWEPAVTEFNLPGQAYYANRVLEDPQGELHGIFHLWGTGSNGYRGRHLDVWYCQTNGAGKSWRQPQKIYDGYVGSIRSFLRLSTGRLLVAFARAVPERQEKPGAEQIDYGWNDIISLYSDDNGQNWQLSANSVRVEIDNTMPVRYGGIEPDVVELTDGRLWMLIRTNKGHLYESFSGDQGQTWQAARPTRFISSDSPAELLRLSDRRLVLLLNSNQRWDNPRSYAAGGREMLHAAISRDEGKTWQGFREVLTMPVAKPDRVEKSDRGTAYASAAETAEGKVALVTGQGDAKSVVLFDPDWLEQTEARDEGETGPILKTEHPALVWNFPATRQGTLKANLDIPPDAQIVSLSLTDHFSVPDDSLAADHAVAEFEVQSAELTKTGAKPSRMMVEIRWDCQKQEALFVTNNRIVARTNFRRQPDFGVNYLRISLRDQRGKPVGVSLHAVAMTGAKKTN
ncbi:sialidase family protein [Larkinella sp.]|uniref:sialidase family protein n=1 Tax=Larkinella sp. TaxID=2034517 RepID=UPI003BAB08CB